jgi:hypothetical protein
MKLEDHIVVWGIVGFGIILAITYYTSRPVDQPTPIPPIQTVGQQVPGEVIKDDKPEDQPPQNDVVIITTAPPVETTQSQPIAQQPLQPPDSEPATIPPQSSLTSSRSGGGSSHSGPEDNNNDFDYSLRLFEGSEHSDGVIDLGQQVRAVASTNDNRVEKVIFRWIDPSTVNGRTIEAALDSSAEDVFEPGESGAWIVEADFGHGIVVREDLDVTFLVVPESQLGAILLISTSLGALGAYLVHKIIKSRKSAEQHMPGSFSFFDV